MKAFLSKPSVKGVVLSLTPIMIAINCSLLGNWDKDSVKFFYAKLIILLLILCFYFFILCYYSVAEVNERKACRIKEADNKVYEKVLSNIIAECNNASSGSNAVIHCITEKGVADLKLWDFQRQCFRLVEQIFNTIVEIRKVEHLEVFYDRLVEDGSKEPSIKLIAYKTTEGQCPKIYEKERVIENPEEGVGVYHDIALFYNGKTDIEVLVNSDEIDREFWYRSAAARAEHKDKFSQYIAIPVLCNDKKMVGLIQIVILKDKLDVNDNNSLGEDKSLIIDEMKRFIKPYAFLALLFHKLEKALVAKPAKEVTSNASTAR